MVANQQATTVAETVAYSPVYRVPCTTKHSIIAISSCKNDNSNSTHTPREHRERIEKKKRELSVYRLVSLIIFQFNFIEQTQSKRFYLCSLFIPYGYFVAAGFYQKFP